MNLKASLWHPVAVVLSGINLVAAGFAAGTEEPWHAMAHVVVAAGFGYWARRIHRRRPAIDEGQGRLELLEDELSNLRAELSETQERLDFAERMLAQQPEARRVGPDR